MWDVYQQHSRRFFQGMSTERTWVFRVSRNVSLSFGNRYERQNGLFDRRDVQRLQLADDDAEAKMERRVEPQPDKLDIMYDLIADLDDEESSIMLYVVDGMKYAEIAAKLNLSETNVSTKIMRIKHKMSKIINTKYKEL